MEEDKEAEYKNLCGKTKLSSRWSIWEHWDDDKDRPEEAYLRNMQSVASFDNWIDFWRIWNVLPHATPTVYFGEYRAKERI